VIAVGEPVLGALGAALFLGEALRATQMVGVVVVCLAVALVVFAGTAGRFRVR
jgi:drug/metabolite transporter (DMT)-like permease